MTDWLSTQDMQPGVMVDTEPPRRETLGWAEQWFQDVLLELCPDGLTDDCSARKRDKNAKGPHEATL